ncbi:MAG TPA: TM0106 family RecB-like putative nuclease [Candidatus Thermoplasmatota archaeon]|nr:TM0106 family RecB-like putative nuclease [Candidatus Thermoplasmatota archaeon]
MRGWITGSTVHQHARSPFAVWCDAHAPPDARDPENEFQELLLRQGREHEARVVAARYPGLAPLDASSEREAFGLALDAMRAGAPVLLQAPLLLPSAQLGGRADVLLRDESAPSIFGSYHYRVLEIKRARNLKAAHRLQGAFYTHVLGRIQQRVPRTFTLVNADGAETLFEHDEREIEAVIEEIRAIRAGRPVAPAYGEGLWPWESFNDRKAVEADDVSLVDGVGPAVRGSLVAAGLATVRALAAAREEHLQGIRGVGQVRRRKLPVAAGALVSRTHVRIGDVRLPETPIEVFFDLEGTSELVEDEVDPIDYLVGCLERRDGEERYHSFVAHTLDGEERMLRDFVSWLAERPQAILFHWHHYEATHMRTMCERYQMMEAWRELIQPRLRDLHKDATAAFAFPTYGTSLKKIAPYLGFHWQHADVNAMQSIAYYLDYVRDPVGQAGKLQKVLDYNEDDCRATRVVKDWLVAQGPSIPS